MILAEYHFNFNKKINEKRGYFVYTNRQKESETLEKH